MSNFRQRKKKKFVKLLLLDMSSSEISNEDYFNNKIKKLQDQLHISYDLSFLLLNEYD